MSFLKGLASLFPVAATVWFFGTTIFGYYRLVASPLYGKDDVMLAVTFPPVATAIGFIDSVSSLLSSDDEFPLEGCVATFYDDLRLERREAVKICECMEAGTAPNMCGVTSEMNRKLLGLK